MNGKNLICENRLEVKEGSKRCFSPNQQLRLVHSRAAGLVNSCHMQRRNGVPETGSEPRTSSPRDTCADASVASPDSQENYFCH